MKNKFRIALFISSLFFASSSLLPSYNPTLTRGEEDSSIIHLGDVIEVPSRTLIHGSDYKEVNGRIIFPSGASFIGKQFTAKEHGIYKVVYEHYFGREKVVEEERYLCERLTQDYFTVDENTKISFGDFRYNDRNNNHKGVIFDVVNGSSITFNEPLDMKDFLKSQPDNPDPKKTYRDPVYGDAVAQSILDFIVDPSVQREMDFGGLLFKLTDVNDISNYIEIRISQHIDASDPRAPAVSWVRVGASCNFSAGWEFGWTGSDGVEHPGRYHTGSSGTGIAMSFKAVSDPMYGNGIIHSGQILFDYNNYSFYNYPGSLTHNGAFFINDLDNFELYRGNEWGGFSEGKCYLTITPFDFYKSTGRLIIKSVGTHDLTENRIIDEKAPKINIDYKGHSVSSLPKAKLGTSYPIFPCSVTDNLDLDLKAKVSVVYKDTTNNKDINVDIVDNKFLVKKEGRYALKYEASDYSGNTATPITLLIDTSNSLDNIVLSSDTTSVSGVVFDEITLPSIESITATGGSGNISISSKLFDPNNEEVEYRNNSFRPELIGRYTLRFIGVDYLGNVGQLDIPVNVEGLDKPIFMEDITLPPVFIKGFTYNLPKIKSIESVGSSNVESIAEIYANGNKIEGEFIPSDGPINIRYVAKGQEEDTVKEFNIDVIDPKDANNKLAEANFLYGNITDKVVNKDDITLSFSEESYFTFANILNSESLIAGFELVDDMNNFSTMEFKISDASNYKNTLTLSLNMDDKKISLPYLESSFAFVGKEVIFEYNDSTFAILDTNKDQVAVPTVNDLGESFAGFENGAYLTITFKDVRGASQIKLTKINNQPIGFKNNSGDKIGPSIRLDSSFVSRQYFGDTFVYPSFKAYDVFSQIKESSIRITKPNDEIIFIDPADKEEFEIEMYGTYMTMYSATDSNGNTSRISLATFVYDDVKPTLEVDKLLINKYHVGDVFSIPKYKASDNMGDIFVDVILIMPTNEMRLLTHDENGQITYALTDASIYNSSFIFNENSFRLEMRGKHTLRYVAYDNEFNKEVIEYVFYVY